MKIRLDDAMQSFSFPFDAVYYYYIPLETVLMFMGGMIYGKAVNGISSEADVKKHPDDFIMLPQIGAEGRMKVMKGFLEALDKEAGGRIRGKLGGTGELPDMSVFENILGEEKLLIAWYNYRDGIYGELARRWCEANGLEMIR